jgi:protoheme IX farnesyltransferase
MLPVVAGTAATIRQIQIYSALLVPISMLPWVLGIAGAMYGAVAAVCGAVFIVRALRLGSGDHVGRLAAERLFAFSVLYLFLLFAALLASNASNRWSFMPSAHAAPTAAASVEARVPRAPLSDALQLDTCLSRRVLICGFLSSSLS